MEDFRVIIRWENKLFVYRLVIDDGTHQVEHRHEVAIKLFIARGNTAKLFNFIEETLH